MAVATNDTYSAASGVTIYGGRAAPSARPAWRLAMTANTWAEVPTTNVLDDLNPDNDPAINPNYPSKPEWSAGATGFAMIIGAWCGACFDPDTDTLWLPLQGGHADYAGNEPYKIRLDVDAPEFVMVRPPSGAIGNLLTTNDGQEATGVYSDGRPRATHSYGKPVYIPGQGPALAGLGATSWSGQAGLEKPVFIDPDTGEARFGATNTISSGANGCYDPTRHVIWARGRGTGKFCRYDIAADSWSSVGTDKTADGHLALCYVEEHDCVLLMTTRGTYNFSVLDCSTGTLYDPVVSGSTVGLTLAGTMQPCWVPSLGAAAVWDNSSSTTVINLLTPGANPFTDAWTVSQLPVDASNDVTPSAKTTNGTWGRFAYSTRQNGFFLLNATSEKPYFFALD